MATKRWYFCPSCNGERRAGVLYSALDLFARHTAQPCSSCATSMELRLRFQLGLGATNQDWRVRGAFLPEQGETWTQADGACVDFRPFLVVLEGAVDASAFIWLPYWHIVRLGDVEKRKYGQWAPLMRADLLQNLLVQARIAGLVG